MAPAIPARRRLRSGQDAWVGVPHLHTSSAVFVYPLPGNQPTFLWTCSLPKCKHNQEVYFLPLTKSKIENYYGTACCQVLLDSYPHQAGLAPFQRAVCKCQKAVKDVLNPEEAGLRDLIAGIGKNWKEPRAIMVRSELEGQAGDQVKCCCDVGDRWGSRGRWVGSP